MANPSRKHLKPGKSHKPAARPRPGLGRGLGALIGAAAEGTPAAVPAEGTPAAVPAETPAATAAAAAGPAPAAPLDSVLQVSVEHIARSPWQPRQSFEATALQELTDSIKAHGVIQPLIGRRRDGGYELIAGERRLRAAIDAGLKTVPVILMDAADRDAAELAIIENIQREDLNVIEEAEGYRTLAENFGLTQQEVADRVGKGRASVANAMRLLDLPDEVKQLVSSGMLSAGHAKVLLSLPDEKEQILLARRCVTEGQTVRALERMIQRRQAEKADPVEKRSDIPESHLRYLLERLHARFQTQIRLVPTVTHANGKRSKGCIEVDFYDNADLDRLLGLLGVEVE